MADRPQAPLVFGPGLDRATGILGVPPRASRDLRNVYLYRDKAQARAGHTTTATLLDEAGNPISHIVLVHAMRSEQVGIVVGYQQTTRAVIVYLVDGNGTNPVRIGTWFTLPAGAHEPPRILAAESYRKLFLAHDEPVLALRAQTTYYDPYGLTELVGLTADLDRDNTAEAIRFRGVQDYLSYLVGWGYGTGSDPDRPEVVRISVPGAPTQWEPEHYFIAGIGFDPVLRCLPTADRLIVFKTSQQFEIVGYDRRTFGIKPSEPLYGLAASRLAVVISGVIYFWSAEGPRATTGGASRDLAWPLDLKAPSPADLVAEGATADGFAVYLPERRVVQFIFGRRCYNLSLWDDTPKWSYGELGISVASGGLIYSDGETGTQAPSAAPSNVSGTGLNPSTLRIQWTNNNLTGGETVEIWLKPTGGTWAKKAAVVASGATQQTDVAGLASGTNYAIATRYRRGTRYSPGSASGNPDDWPAAQKATGTTSLNAPTLDDTAWSRTSATTEQVHLTWTNAHADRQTKIYRNGVLIHTVAAGVSSYDDTTISGETTYAYKLRHTADIDSPDSNTIQQWTGPDLPPTSLSASPSGCASPQNLVEWTNGDASLFTEVWGRNITRSIGYSVRATANPGQTGICATAPGAVTGDTVAFNVRHKLTSFGVDDFSPYYGGSANPQLDEVQTTVP